jgi:hypothetical protein
VAGKLSEREGEFMETHKAEISTIDSEQYLNLSVGDVPLRIPLTTDEPNAVKQVFNALIIHLKKGLFCFSMEENEDGDLIYQVAKEYVKQLNKELSDIHKELEANNLIEDTDDLLAEPTENKEDNKNARPNN